MKYSQINDRYRYKLQLLKISSLLIIIYEMVLLLLSGYGLIDRNFINSFIGIAYAVSAVFVFTLLKYRSDKYYLALYIIVLFSLVAFTSSLITLSDTTARYVWFHILVFASFFLGGKKVGIIVSISSLFIFLIYFYSSYNTVNISDEVQILISLLVISQLSYFYNSKFEDNENELLSYKEHLEDKVSSQVSQIKEKTQQFETIFETTKDGIAIVDSESNFMFVNKAYVEMTGFAKEELLNKSCLELTPAEEMDKAGCILSSIIENGIYESYEKNLIVKDGRKIVVSMNMSMMPDKQHLLISMRDITRSKEIEIAQKNSENRFKHLIESTDQWIWEVDSNGVYTYASPQVEKLLGYSVDEVIGKTPFDFMDEKEANKIGAIFADIVTNQEKIVELVNINRHKDGRNVYLMTSGAPFFDEDGMLAGYRGMDKDITEQREKDQQLFQKSRLAQMGEMISMIAHQWRQPLGAIASTAIDLKLKMGLKQFDMEDVRGRAECELYFDKSLNNIEEYVNVLTTTIDDFRNFYKPEKDRELIAIDMPIKRALKIIGTSINTKNIEIIQDISSQKEYKLYKNEMMQVILNILKNAEDNFLEKNIINPKIYIKTYDFESGSIIEILDNGGGISEDILDKIFEPYFSTKNKKNGTGLGLYMSKLIVEKHNKGKLEVQNTNEGVSFRIVLSA